MTRCITHIEPPVTLQRNAHFVVRDAKDNRALVPCETKMVTLTAQRNGSLLEHLGTFVLRIARDVGCGQEMCVVRGAVANADITDEILRKDGVHPIRIRQRAPESAANSCTKMRGSASNGSARGHMCAQTYLECSATPMSRSPRSRADRRRSRSARRLSLDPETSIRDHALCLAARHP
jgi:hypothetical protein